MKKVNITKSIEYEFKKLVLSIFRNGILEKKENKEKNKKIKFSIKQDEIDKLLQKKFKDFDANISFEKLIVSNLEYIRGLKKFYDGDNKEKIKFEKDEEEYFLTLYERLKKPEYIELLGITTCLYCNRNYAFNFSKGSKLNATAQLDHFFDKKDYPFLAICLYNLVPSCSTCNQRKSTKKVDILHPFEDCFDKKSKFKLHIIDSNFYYKRESIKLELISEDEKAKNSIETFNLNNLYNHHKDVILELIQKDVIYSDSYLDELLKEYEGTLFKNREDLQRLISCGYMSNDDINQRPLSKLIKDISEEL